MMSSRRARVILASLIALCALYAYSYAMRLSERAAVEAEIVAMQAQVEAALERKLQLEAELAALDDPNFLERMARQEFEMARPGDTVLVIVRETPIAPQPQAATAMAPAPALDGRQSQPVWRQWVDFFATDLTLLQ